MAKKINTTKNNFKKWFNIGLAWVLIPLWMIVVFIFVNNTALFSTFDPETTNLLLACLVLIPIAMIAFPLSYRMDLSRYATTAKIPRLSTWHRILYSTFITAIVVIFSWYFYAIAPFALSYLFDT